MRNSLIILFVALATIVAAQDKAKKTKKVYPAAILEFAERGKDMKGQGKNIADIMFASLMTSEKILLVERDDLKKVIEELTLNKSGVVAANEAAKIGQLTGAKIIITGSVFKAGKKTYLVAKIIGTETGRVIGTSVNGEGELPDLTEDLAKKVSAMVDEKSDKLMPPGTPKDMLAALKETMAGKKLPSAFIEIKEKHIGRPAVDPAAQTEVTLFYRGVGGTVLERGGSADLKITGEAFSEFAADLGLLKSVKARVEVKVTDRDGKVVAVDRQTAVNVDMTELAAGKAAIQEAAARIAVRLIPKLQAKKK